MVSICASCGKHLTSALRELARNIGNPLFCSGECIDLYLLKDLLCCKEGEIKKCRCKGYMTCKVHGNLHMGDHND